MNRTTGTTGSGFSQCLLTEVIHLLWGYKSRVLVGGPACTQPGYKVNSQNALRFRKSLTNNSNNFICP